MITIPTSLLAILILGAARTIARAFSPSKSGVSASGVLNGEAGRATINSSEARMKTSSKASAAALSAERGMFYPPEIPKKVRLKENSQSS